MSEFRRCLSFNDILLVPRNSELEHVSDANLEYNYADFSSIPIINAPMTSVCSRRLLATLNFKYQMPITIHRWFKSAKEQMDFYENCGILDNKKVFVAVGMISKWKAWIDYLIAYQIENKEYFGFLVDVANGDTKHSVETVEYLEKNCPYSNIMAGNVCTKSGFLRLQEAGANFIRVGIGGGSTCTTRTNVGFGMPTLTSILDCAKVKGASCLVADGGIEYPGDIVKAIVAGADMVMLGKMFAATSLSAGEKVDSNFKATKNTDEYKYVKYQGMASAESIKSLNSTKTSISVEGKSGYIKYQGTTEDVINSILGNLRSAVAYYGGCTNWNDFKRKIKIIEITDKGWSESLTRIEE